MKYLASCAAASIAAAAFALAGCEPPNPPAKSAAFERPVFELATDAAYDIKAIGAYDGDHAAVYDYIDANLDQHIGAIQRWLRQPSISAQNIGILEMAELLRQDLDDLGFAESNLVPTDGHPGVWGYYDAGAEKTLVVYLMYDVQPVNPEDWISPPFDAEIIDHDLGKVIMARGATNQKGPQRALLNAIESIIAVEGNLPVNIMVAAEGEEELGSPNNPQIIDAYEDRLQLAVARRQDQHDPRRQGHSLLRDDRDRWRLGWPKERRDPRLVQGNCRLTGLAPYQSVVVDDLA